MKKIILSMFVLASLQSYADGNFDNVPVYRVFGKTIPNTASDIQSETIKCEKELLAKAAELKQLKMTILKIDDCTTPPPMNSMPQNTTYVHGSLSFIR